MLMAGALFAPSIDSQSLSHSRRQPQVAHLAFIMYAQARALKSCVYLASYLTRGCRVVPISQIMAGVVCQASYNVLVTPSPRSAHPLKTCAHPEVPLEEHLYLIFFAAAAPQNEGSAMSPELEATCVFKGHVGLRGKSHKTRIDDILIS